MVLVLRWLAVLLVVSAALVGCGAKGSPPVGSTAAGASQSAAADPTGDPGDQAPIDQSCPTSNTTPFAKTKFVAHSGLAFGVFHRYLYKPYQAGTFKSGASGRITAFVKGGLAALFIKREIRLATEDVKANPTLCKVVAAPLAKVGDTVKSAFDRLKGGDASGITDLSSTITSIEGTSKGNGVDIAENDNANLASKPS
jgi:predicted small lipoprotein YifL